MNITVVAPAKGDVRDGRIRRLVMVAENVKEQEELSRLSADIRCKCTPEYCRDETLWREAIKKERAEADQECIADVVRLLRRLAEDTKRLDPNADPVMCLNLAAESIEMTVRESEKFLASLERESTGTSR